MAEERRLTVYADSVTLTGDGGQVTGSLKENFRPVKADIPAPEARRLIRELARTTPGFTGTEPPKVEISVEDITWIGPEAST